jgi:hypothetical protein
MGVQLPLPAPPLVFYFVMVTRPSLPALMAAGLFSTIKAASECVHLRSGLSQRRRVAASPVRHNSDFLYRTPETLLEGCQTGSCAECY